MSIANDRDFYKNFDQKFKITEFLKKFPLLDAAVIWSCNIFVNTLKIFKGLRQEPVSNRILIICLHRIGDTVFNTPAIKEIFNYHKNSEILLLCFEDTKPIIQLILPEKNIRTINKGDLFLQRRIPNKKARQTVRQINPSTIYDLTGMPLSAGLILSTNAKKVIGMNIPYLKSIYNYYTPVRVKPHIVDTFYDVVRTYIPHSDLKEKYDFTFKASETDRIIIHPFGIRRSKEWNLRKFILLAERLAVYYPVSIVSAPGYIEKDIEREIDLLENITLTITKDLNHLIDELRNCFLFIGNDSGPAYIAAFLGKPTYVIYGPTNPKYSLPFGGHHAFFMKQLKCSAVNEKHCFTMGGIYCPSNECMQLIEVYEIEEEIHRFFKKLKTLTVDSEVKS